ncbi:MAG: glycerol-3-phosphate dehydrogenase/oxidase [Planctomycetaceae bacterium]|nr:glycerol-3-phosphate dehydrogenase/oxidase [Planctomycetales bacterium]MCB9923631.1 glycerol-3-phosphate dehydrogenase/oxidase [Planctomycetaceae bacterium]
MKRALSPLSDNVFDLAIIGGGILGAGVARDAAMRGLSVALVEKGDFAGGTSSRSTKLIHGGLRYLEQFSLGLVAESCRERSILLDMAPHLVTPLSFLLPAYAGDPRSLAMLRLGTTLYDWITPRRHAATPRHRTLSAAETATAEPCLPSEHLHGSVLFYDCQMDDARLCLETILDACRHGAVCRNYVEVTGFRRSWDRIEALQVVDVLQGDSFDVRARCYVNATGPWIERVSQLSSGNAARIALSPTKGVHLVIPRINHEHGIYFQSRRDRRMIFLLPWGDDSLLGTTDTRFDKVADKVRPEMEDVEYLLDQLRSLAPSHAIQVDDVLTSFAGVRALIHSKRNPSRRSREEQIVASGDNLLAVAGGKYTTFRAISDQVVRRVYRMLGQRAGKCRTAEAGLPNLRPAASGALLSQSPKVCESDIAFACSEEMGVTVEDVMRRRTRLALSRHGGVEVASPVSHIMAKSLGWTDGTREAYLAQYLRGWKQNKPWE